MVEQIVLDTFILGRISAAGFTGWSEVVPEDVLSNAVAVSFGQVGDAEVVWIQDGKKVVGWNFTKIITVHGADNQGKIPWEELELIHATFDVEGPTWTINHASGVYALVCDRIGVKPLAISREGVQSMQAMATYRFKLRKQE